MIPEPQRYAIAPESLQGCRLRILFRFGESQLEKDLIVRANIAQYLARATATLALLEADEARKVVP